jgi:hypothetical protein
LRRWRSRRRPAGAGWRELVARGFEVRLAEPVQARGLLGRRRSAKTDRLDAPLYRATRERRHTAVARLTIARKIGKRAFHALRELELAAT